MTGLPLLHCWLIIIITAHHTLPCSCLAGRGQGRRSRAPPAVEYNAATATILDVDDRRDLAILWGMAGQTSRRRRAGGRAVVDNSNKITPNEDLKPTIVHGDVESVIIDSPRQVAISLTNGTTFTTDPREFHQRRDFALWMKTREQLDVTASELGALVNRSHFSNREELVQKKAGLLPTKPLSVSSSKACRWGLKMEPQALKQYRQVTGNTVQETGLWIRQQQPSADGASLWLGASPDGIVHDSTDGTTGLLEIKSLWGRRHKKELPQFDHCPRRFWDQVQGQLAIADREWCDLMLYIPPSHRNRKNYCILRVQRDRDYWDTTLLPAVLQLSANVKAVKEEMSLQKGARVE